METVLQIDPLALVKEVRGKTPSWLQPALMVMLGSNTDRENVGMGSLIVGGNILI